MRESIPPVLFRLVEFMQEKENWCGTCGKALGLRYWTGKRHRICACTTYAHDTKACTDHRIFYEDLYKAVLADIQYHARLAYADREKEISIFYTFDNLKLNTIFLYTSVFPMVTMPFVLD